MPALDTIVAEYRAELARREQARVRDMVLAYHAIWLRIEPQVDDLTLAIEAARARGDKPFVALYERERLAMLQNDTIRELQRLTGRTYAEIVREQAHAAGLGTQSAQAFLRAVIDVAGFGSSASIRLPTAAIEAVVAALSEGSPLRALLAGLAPQAWRDVEAALIEAVALGRNPRQIATAVRDALDVSRWRALTIARTEILRAYRTSQLESYRHTNVVRGWVWLAAVGAQDPRGRTCPACIAMHGRWFPLSEPMSEHPNGRCSQAPALGFPDADGYYRGEPFGATGPEWFAGLPAAEQRAILGPSKYAAWLAGDISLEDLVSVRASATWGVTRSVASLAEAIARASERSAAA